MLHLTQRQRAVADAATPTAEPEPLNPKRSRFNEPKPRWMPLPELGHVAERRGALMVIACEFANTP